MGFIQKYINLYFNKLLQKCVWRRFTNSQLLLGYKTAETLKVSACHAKLESDIYE
ncbi:MAG: hypothetical protein QXL94_06995 [Candidatus Parvarchaeum sp.]